MHIFIIHSFSLSLGKHSHRLSAGLLFLYATVLTLFLDTEWNKKKKKWNPPLLLSFQSSIIHPPYSGPHPHTQLSVPLLSRGLFLAAVLLFWNLLLTGCCWVSGRRSLLECLAYSQTTPESHCRVDGSRLWLQLSACCSCSCTRRSERFSVLYHSSTLMYH